MTLKKLKTLSLILLLLGGCATMEEDPTDSWSAEKFYKEAKQALSFGDYETAIQYFEKLEARYPFGQYAKQAQLDTAYAYYKYNETESAIAACDRFIKLHPRHAKVDYAYYLKGLAAYKIDADSFLGFVAGKRSQRDPKSARQAFQYFSELIKRFPESEYSADARQRMVYLRNLLAEYELNVANYYLKRGAFLAAVNRAKYVLENFQRTPSVPDALVIMVQAYRKLGTSDLAGDALRVLESNYPEHPQLAVLKKI